MSHTVEQLANEFKAAGIRPSGILLIHTSLSSLKTPTTPPPSPDMVIDALLLALGPEGTLLIPTLSYLFVSEASPHFDVRATPTNLGAIPAAMLRRPGVVRSLHPTHSVAALGRLARELTCGHREDRTPVGPNSPFSLVARLNGQVAFLGCGARCNTSIHGVEETVLPRPPPYLLRPGTVRYRVVDEAGAVEEVEHRRHDFAGVAQRYERLRGMVPKGEYAQGRVGVAVLEVFEAPSMWAAARRAVTADPEALVARCAPGEEEDHHLKPARGGEYFSYTVGPTPTG